MPIPPPWRSRRKIPALNGTHTVAFHLGWPGASEHSLRKRTALPRSTRVTLGGPAEHNAQRTGTSGGPAVSQRNRTVLPHDAAASSTESTASPQRPAAHQHQHVVVRASPSGCGHAMNVRHIGVQRPATASAYTKTNTARVSPAALLTHTSTTTTTRPRIHGRTRHLPTSHETTSLQNTEEHSTRAVHVNHPRQSKCVRRASQDPAAPARPLCTSPKRPPNRTTRAPPAHEPYSNSVKLAAANGAPRSCSFWTLLCGETPRHMGKSACCAPVEPHPKSCGRPNQGRPKVAALAHHCVPAPWSPARAARPHACKKPCALLCLRPYCSRQPAARANCHQKKRVHHRAGK